MLVSLNRYQTIRNLVCGTAQTVKMGRKELMVGIYPHP